MAAVAALSAFSAQAVERGHRTDIVQQNFSARSNAHMPVYGEALPPVGYVGFCRSFPQECKTRRFDPVRVVLTDQRWRELKRINTHINRTVAPVTDLDLYNVAERWTYPTSRGDCEDYVLLKRRYLINMGWPEQALLITVVRDRNGDGHAVLTVATDRGDFILDNQAADVLPWRKTPYRYEMRQSQSERNAWVSLNAANPNAGQLVTARR